MFFQPEIIERVHFILKMTFESQISCDDFTLFQHHNITPDI